MRITGRELETLLSPHRTQDFLTRYWGKTPLYIQGSASKFAGLKFDLAALETLLRDLEPRDRMRIRFVGADDKVRPVPIDLAHYSIRDGELTVCADWINDRLERLASYCAGIKVGLGLPGSVFMTCYASPAGHGFGTHFDCQPSFILQIEGSKRWRFSAKPAVQWPPTALPNARIAEEIKDRYPWLQVRFPGEVEKATFLEQVLNPGDALFLPAGTWHQARAIRCSLALTMSCIPMTAADFVDDLIRGHLSRSINWRRNVPPVPMGASRPERLPTPVKRFFDARLSELRSHVKSLRAEDLYETWTHHVASFDLPYGTDDTRHARPVKVTDTLTMANTFPLRYVTRPGNGSVSLYYLDNRIDLAYDALPLVREMLKRSSFPAHIATQWLGKGYEWPDVQPLLQELVQAGILRTGRSTTGRRRRSTTP